MASLLKPTDCPNCDSIDFKHLRKPERWVCVSCETVISQRPGRGIPGVCRDCGVEEADSVKFKAGKNQCITCYNKYQAEYRNKTKEELKEYRKKRYHNNRSEIRAYNRKYIQQSPLRFLTDFVRRCRNTANRKNYDFDLDVDYLLELWNENGGKCFITGISMKHELSKVNSVSIDRINPDGGYTKGNVQLVCKGVNLLKSDHTQQETIEFFQQLVSLARLENVTAYEIYK